MDAEGMFCLIILIVLTVILIVIFTTAYVIARVTGKDNFLWEAKKPKNKNKDDI